MDYVGFHGAGLHSGASCSVELTRVVGPLSFFFDQAEVLWDEMTPRVEDGRLALVLRRGGVVHGVEHLFAALAGVGAHQGIEVGVVGPELPLLDASAFELAVAVRALAPPRDAPRLRVVQSGEILAGSARYSFEPKTAIDVAVEVDEPPFGRQRAGWDGNPRDFVDRIAPARIYDRTPQEGRFLASAAAGAHPATVLVLRADGSAEPPGAPPSKDELARHRLLDLLAHLYLSGGPPLGRIRAFEPNHAASQHAIRQALEFGFMARRP